MNGIGRTALALAVTAVVVTLAACHDRYDADVEPGPNGEPGSALAHVCGREFKVAKDDYFAALNERHVRRQGDADQDAHDVHDRRQVLLQVGPS